MDLGTYDRPSGWPKLISYLFWAKKWKKSGNSFQKGSHFMLAWFSNLQKSSNWLERYPLASIWRFFEKASSKKALKFYPSLGSKMMIFAFKNSLFETTKILSLSSVWGQNSPKWPTFCRCRRPDQIAEGNLTIFSYTIIVPGARRWHLGCLFLGPLSIPLG